MEPAIGSDQAWRFVNRMEGKEDGEFLQGQPRMRRTTVK
jgi:hypothetical protein